jgi:hypothetical protein
MARNESCRNSGAKVTFNSPTTKIVTPPRKKMSRIVDNSKLVLKPGPDPIRNF